MWLNLVATGVTILSHFQERRSTRGYLGNCQRGLVRTLTPTLNDWPGWSCMMQQLEAAFLVVWVGGQHTGTPICLLTQSLNRWGSLHEPTLQIDSLPPCSFHCLGGRLAGLCMGACSTYYTQTGSPSWKGQPNVIVRFHLRLTEGVVIRFESSSTASRY